eukprot:766747-Hanusia_phi.AAC.2
MDTQRIHARLLEKQAKDHNETNQTILIQELITGKEGQEEEIKAGAENGKGAGGLDRQRRAGGGAQAEVGRGLWLHGGGRGGGGKHFFTCEANHGIQL